MGWELPNELSHLSKGKPDGTELYIMWKHCLVNG